LEYNFVDAFLIDGVRKIVVIRMFGRRKSRPLLVGGPLFRGGTIHAGWQKDAMPVDIL
jgi:hypothetical protein